MFDIFLTICKVTLWITFWSSKKNSFFVPSSPIPGNSKSKQRNKVTNLFKQKMKKNNSEWQLKKTLDQVLTCRLITCFLSFKWKLFDFKSENKTMLIGKARLILQTNEMTVGDNQEQKYENCWDFADRFYCFCFCMRSANQT